MTSECAGGRYCLRTLYVANCGEESMSVSYSLVSRRGSTHPRVVADKGGGSGGNGSIPEEMEASAGCDKCKCFDTSCATDQSEATPCSRIRSLRSRRPLTPP